MSSTLDSPKGCNVLNRLWDLLGWDAVLLPIPKGTKKPVFKAWQQTTWHDANEPECVGKLQDAAERGGNLGVLLGAPSGGLVAIDLDSDELIEPFLELNPKLRKTLRSRGARGCQLWLQMKGDDYPQIGPYNLMKEGDEVGEWRCCGLDEHGNVNSGAQSVIFGQHPDTGEDYQLLVEAPPIEISYNEIKWLDWVKPPHVEEQERQERKRKAEAGKENKQAPDWVERLGITGDLSTLDLVGSLNELGCATTKADAGKTGIECPWASEHTGTDKLLDTAVLPGKWPQFHCLHIHCKGRGLEQVCEWAERKSPGIVSRYCTSDFKKQQKEESDSAESKHEPYQGPLITFLSPSAIRAYEPPEGSVLVGDNHIVQGSVFVLGGAPGVGKSRGTVALAEAGANHPEWLGYAIHRRFKTMILQTENGRHRLKNELSSIKSDIDDWVRISPPPPLGLQWGKREFRDQLKRAIDDFGPDVFIIDPWNATARDQTQKEYLDAFEVIQSVLPTGDDKPAIGIAAHTRKPKSDERHSGRALLNLLAGSYVLGSVPRCVWVIQAATDDVEDERVVLTCCKNNDGNLGARSAWVRKNGLFAAVREFDWDEFDSNGTAKKLTWRDLPQILKESGLCGLVNQARIAEVLMNTGKSRATAYRWIEQADEDKLLPRSGDYYGPF
jgi:hypothetical protein